MLSPVWSQPGRSECIERAQYELKLELHDELDLKLHAELKLHDQLDLKLHDELDLKRELEASFLCEMRDEKFDNYSMISLPRQHHGKAERLVGTDWPRTFINQIKHLRQSGNTIYQPIQDAPTCNGNGLRDKSLTFHPKWVWRSLS